jgi:hypothetical protein
MIQNGWMRLLVLCAGLAGAAVAQRDLATILGTVTDPTGGVVAGAKVTIIEDLTGVREAVESDAAGNYIRPLLKPGTYTIEVEMTGFKKAVQRNVSLNAGDRVQVNMRLEVGEITQAVEVTAAPPALQSESAVVGATLPSRKMAELPLFGQRKFTFFARVVPGVVPAEPGARDAAGGGFSANGVRSNGQNNFLLNGVDNNVNVIDFINQTAYVIGPSVEAIGEMNILTNGYNAEYGRGAGGVINVTIKSGTNELHGTLFEFLQHEKLTANKWENNRAGLGRGSFKQNQFGAAVGGPIIKDRTFWFADYQGTRIRSRGGAVPGIGNVWTRTIPWPAFKNGDFSRLLTGRNLGTDAAGRPVPEGAIFDIRSQTTVGNQIVRTMFPNNIVPASRFDSAAKRLIDQYPSPNQNLNDRIASSNFLLNSPGQQQNDQADLRIDHRLSDKDSLFGSLSWSEEDKFNEPPFPTLDAAGFAGESEKNQGRNAMLSWTRIWKPNLITETRLAFTRLITARTQANSGKDLFTEFGIRGLNPTSVALNGGLPLINPDQYSTVGGSEWLPTLEYSNVWDFIENVSINKGRHAIKFGFEYRPIGFPFFQVPSPRGQFQFPLNRTQHPQFQAGTGDGVAGWLLGAPGFSRITTNNFISSEKVAYAWYVQNDWKVTPKLTLNLGVRYELFSPIGEQFGRQSHLDQDRLVLVIPKGKDQDLPLPPNFARDFPAIRVERGIASKYLIDWDKTDWSPRIGVAWEAMDKTVLRAGYGIFYGGEENQGGNPNRGENIPFNQETRFELPNNFALNPFINTFSDGFPLNSFTLPAPIAHRTIAPNFRNPLVHKWNFAVQRALPGNMTFEATYIGSKGQRLVNLNDPNQPRNDPNPAAPVNPRRRIPLLGAGTITTNSNGFSRYHALSSKLEKRYSSGVDFLFSYTWGHALTNVGTTLAGGPGVRDVTNWTAEYAHANFHVKHRFVYSTNWSLPIGRGRRIGSDWGRGLDAVLGGWQLNGILTLQSGNAFSLGTRNASCGCGGTVRPDAVPGKNPDAPPPGGRTPDRWFDITAVTRPAPGTFGNLGHYSNYGPGIRNVDLSLFKDFRLTERYRLQLRSEWFNFANTPQFNVQTIDATEGSGGFGRISGTQPGTERHVQFALRFQF